MKDDPFLKETVKTFSPILVASLDAVAIINNQCRLVFANTTMRTLLKIRKRELNQYKVFCDLITFQFCEKGCQIKDIVAKGKKIRFDETPAQIGETLIRVLIKGVPLYLPNSKSKKPIGAVISMRDSTAEVVMQAKYHKALKVLEEREDELTEVRKKLQKIVTTS